MPALLDEHDLSFGLGPRDVPLLRRVRQDHGTCPVCGGEELFTETPGTQRVEQELNERFPDARVLRMDADTMNTKGAHEKLFSAFAKGEADILLGTQMVTKGLDFRKT